MPMRTSTTCGGENPAAIATPPEGIPTRLEIVTGYLRCMIGNMADRLQDISTHAGMSHDGALANDGLTYWFIAGEYLDEMSRLVLAVYAMERGAAVKGVA